MANLTFTIDDTIATRALTSFCASYGFTGTQAQMLAFLKSRTIIYWEDRIKMYEDPPIADAAKQTNDAQINSFNIT